MPSRTISRFDIKGLVHQQILKGSKVDQALGNALKEAANHAVTVFDQTGDISVAVSSMGLGSPEVLEARVRELTGDQALTKQEFLNSVLRVVGGGGVTAIPTANCLYGYLPHDRKPTREEMEEAWEKCSRKAASASL
jgi:hypothetical protein